MSRITFHKRKAKKKNLRIAHAQMSARGERERVMFILQMTFDKYAKKIQ